MPTGCLAQQRRLRRSQHGWPRHTAMPPRSTHQNAVMVRFPGKTAVEVSSLGTPCIPALPRVGILVATCCRFSPRPLWNTTRPMDFGLWGVGAVASYRLLLLPAPGYPGPGSTTLQSRGIITLSSYTSYMIYTVIRVLLIILYSR